MVLVVRSVEGTLMEGTLMEGTLMEGTVRVLLKGLDPVASSRSSTEGPAGHGQG